MNHGLNYLLIAPRISLLPYPHNMTTHTSDFAMIPLGMAYISASMKIVSENIFNLNLEFEHGNVVDEIRNAIKLHKINVVLTGGLSGQFSKIRQVLDAVKAIDESIITIIGGGVITSAPTIAMTAFERADIGVIGEGEITVQELVKALDSNGNIEKISGIIYKCNGDFVTTTHRIEIKNLDSIPFPDYNGLGYHKLWNISGTAIVSAGRSCPFRCTFCFNPSGSTYRTRTIDSLIHEISSIINTHDAIHSIAIEDELFVTKRSKIEEFCEKIKPLNVNWGCTAHPSTLKNDLLKTMRVSGCVAINIGVDSASQKVLASMNRKTSLHQIENALRMIQENGIAILGNLIFGDIAENKTTVEESLHWWRKNRRYMLNLGPIYAFPGTKIYDHAVTRGIIKDPIAFLRADCPPVNISQLTEQEYKELPLRLTSEEAFCANPPKTFSILSVDTNTQKTQVRFACQCGFVTNMQTRGILLSSNIQCPVCRQNYTLPYHEHYSAQLLREKIETLIRTHDRIAFWGLGREMLLLLKKINLSSLDNAFLIDKDPRKQGLLWSGKIIHSPSILKTESIRAVIQSPLLGAGVRYLDTIEQEVSKISNASVFHFGELFKNSPDEKFISSHN